MSYGIAIGSMGVALAISLAACQDPAITPDEARGEREAPNVDAATGGPPLAGDPPPTAPADASQRTTVGCTTSVDLGGVSMVLPVSISPNSGKTALRKRLG